MLDATGSVMFTAAFGVAKQLIGPLAKERDFLRFVLMEKPPTGEAKAELTADCDLIISYGAVLNDMYTMQGGKAVAKGKIAESDLEKWYFEKEALYRKQGNIFYIHTKFLLDDALSNDPLVCSGSANFSANSLQQNDENMLLIRGNTAGGRHLYDRVRPHLPSLLFPRHRQSARARRQERGRRLSRRDERLDRQLFQAERLQV
jgi:phosphatidylserine/phosphatidylglycerophosphate/cardiolipin synthase-like enzyme